MAALDDRLVQAQLSGQALDLRGEPEADRRIDGAQFARLLTCADPKSAHPSGLRVAGLVVAGRCDLNYCTLARPLQLVEAHFEGPLVMGRLQIPALDVLGCTLDDVWAPSLSVTYSLCLDGSTIARQLWLLAATVGGDLVLDGLTVRHEDAGRRGGAASAPALTLYGAHVSGSTVMQRARISGLIRMSNADLGGDVIITATVVEQVRAGARAALLEARRTRFGADVLLRDTTIDGEVFAPNCTVAGVFDAGGCVLGAPDTAEDAVTLDGASIGGDLLLTEGLRARGAVRLVDVAVGGSLHLQDCTLSAPPGESALMAVGTKVSGTLTLRRIDLAGGLTLYRACADELDDAVGVAADGTLDLGVWSGASSVDLREVDYRAFGHSSSTDAGHRIAWLKALPAYDDTAWRRLGQVYLGQGREEDARHVAMAAQDERCRRTLTGMRRLGRRILGVTIGHGYEPGRAVVIAAVWVVLLTLVVQVWSGDVVRASTPTTLPYAAAFALDVFLPIIDLGLADGWKVTGVVQWACWASILAGWALSTLIVAAFSRVVRDP